MNFCVMGSTLGGKIESASDLEVWWFAHLGNKNAALHCLPRAKMHFCLVKVWIGLVYTVLLSGRTDIQSCLKSLVVENTRREMGITDFLFTFGEWTMENFLLLGSTQVIQFYLFIVTDWIQVKLAIFILGWVLTVAGVGILDTLDHSCVCIIVHKSDQYVKKYFEYDILQINK